MIVYEDNRFGGFGAEIAAILAEEAFDYLDGPDRARDRAGRARACPYNHVLEDWFMPNPDRIAERREAPRRLLMATASARIALVALVVAAVFIAGCAAATPSPRTIGLHVENRLGNIVLFSVGYHWVGTPPPPSANNRVLAACGGSLDLSVPATEGGTHTLLSMGTDSSGELDNELALAENDLDQVPLSALEKALTIWSAGDLTVDSWLTVTPTEVLRSSTGARGIRRWRVLVVDVHPEPEPS